MQVTLTPEQIKAIHDAADLLQTEGNVLADVLRKDLKAVLSTRTDELQGFADGVPHRVQIAIRNEMERLRKNASLLLSIAPKQKE